MLGTMMERQLTIDALLEHGGTYFPKQEIVTRTESGIHRYTFGDFYLRTRKLANALKNKGVENGERVATFCWNHYRHLELYFGIPITGSVLHTVNIRLFEDQIIYIFNHAKDRILFVDRSLFPVIEPLMDKLPLLKTIILIGDGENPSAPTGKELIDYEDFISDESDAFDYIEMNERSPLGLCYTSGTTGDPKGVMYTHRSTVLHTLAISTASTLGFTPYDSVMPVVPMFHANAWGQPYACIMVGAKIVLPGPSMDPTSILSLLKDEGVTFSAGVPTIWAGVLEILDKEPGQVPKLKRIISGGSAVAKSMIKAFEERHGIKIIHAWGMTQTSPSGTVYQTKPHLPQKGEEYYDLRSAQGIPFPLFEIRAFGDDGNIVPCDGKTMGDLVVRGPWVAQKYYQNEEASRALLTDDGWMRTGDVVTIDEEGYMRIMDRTKDLIKSGGEWISSVDLENTLMGHPEIKEAAVIAIPDAKWQERPLAFIVVNDSKEPSKQELDEYLLKEFAKWQLPDKYVVIGEIPKTSVGKFSKKDLRIIAKKEEFITD